LSLIGLGLDCQRNGAHRNFDQAEKDDPALALPAASPGIHH
jgi:hypothetical protein